MNKIFMLLSFSAVAFGSLALVTSKALAYRGDPAVHGPFYSEERHEDMTAAFENKDYNAWKELMQGRGRVSQVINEQNFDRFAEAHKLMLEGNVDAANEIKAELGLGIQNRNNKVMGRGYGNGFNR